MSLFRELRSLFVGENEQTEDALTEVVAEVLRNNHELAGAWLESLRITGDSEAEIHSVETQYRVSGHPEHETGSRIDLAIRFSTSQGPEVVFVESKVRSGQTEGQLQRYAELLQEECRSHAAKGTLVFITQVFEPFCKPAVEGFAFHFIQARWLQFYNILKSRSSSDGLEKQLMLFMEENHMSVGNQFRSTDLVALEHFRGAKALMDKTLEEVLDRLKKFGGKGVGLNKAMTRLRIFGEYELVQKFDGFEILLGYRLPEAVSEESVWLEIRIISDPKALNRATIIDAFGKWVNFKDETWEAWDLDNPSVWSTINRWSWLCAFQTTDDHVVAIKQFFHELLDDLEEFRRMFPNLGWTPEESKDDSEGG
jgi:hypothetical protein